MHDQFTTPKFIESAISAISLKAATTAATYYASWGIPESVRVSMFALRQEGLKFSATEETETGWKMSFKGNCDLLLEWQGPADEDRAANRAGSVAGVLKVPKADNQSLSVEFTHLP